MLHLHGDKKADAAVHVNQSVRSWHFFLPDRIAICYVFSQLLISFCSLCEY